MINTLKITKYIRKFLLDNEELKKIIGTNIFPIVANANTKYPFITLQRTGVISEYQKDGLTQDIITYEIIAVSNDYSQSLDIITLVRNTLEMKLYRSEEFNIHSMLLDGVTEEYAEDAYIQRMTLRIKCL